MKRLVCSFNFGLSKYVGYFQSVRSLVLLAIVVFVIDWSLRILVVSLEIPAFEEDANNPAQVTVIPRVLALINQASRKEAPRTLSLKSVAVLIFGLFVLKKSKPEKMKTLIRFSASIFVGGVASYSVYYLVMFGPVDMLRVPGIVRFNIADLGLILGMPFVTFGFFRMARGRLLNS